MEEGNEREALLSIATNRYIEEALFIRPFNASIQSLGPDGASMRFAMHEGLSASVRNPNLQGGAIAAILDVVGSLAVFANVVPQIKGKTVAEKVANLEKGLGVGMGAWKMSTIDLRIDYLRPGRGKAFIADAKILRIGNKVAVTRMELHNDEGKLIAAGTGTYIL